MPLTTSGFADRSAVEAHQLTKLRALLAASDQALRAVECGRTGRVRVTTLTREFFMPPFLEREEASRSRRIYSILGTACAMRGFFPVPEDGSRGRRLMDSQANVGLMGRLSLAGIPDRLSVETSCASSVETARRVLWHRLLSLPDPHSDVPGWPGWGDEGAV